MDGWIRHTFGVIFAISIIVFLGGLIWLVVNKVKKRKLKLPMITVCSSLLIGLISISSVLYFWDVLGNGIVIRHSQYKNYENIAKSVNVLYHAPEHSDSIKYDAKIKSAKKILKQTTNTDIANSDSKTRNNGRKSIYDLAVGYADDSRMTLEYGKSILSYHIFKDLSGTYNSKDTLKVINRFDKVAEK